MLLNGLWSYIMVSFHAKAVNINSVVSLCVGDKRMVSIAPFVLFATTCTITSYETNYCNSSEVQVQAFGI